MPIGPDDWAALATAIGTGLGGLWGGITYQKKASGKPPSGPEDESAILSAIDQLGNRVDGVGRQVNGVKLTVEGLVEDVQRHTHEINRLKPVVGGIAERVGILESQIQPNRNKSGI
jgi:hypothetical protein